MILRFSPLDANRFGLRIYRATLDHVDVDALVAEIERERVDVAILRVPAPAVASLASLGEHGLSMTVADTVVRYEIDLAQARFDADARVMLRDATSADAARLETLAREIFAGYVTHYHSNPLFATARILDGYAEWATRHVRGDGDGASAWLVEFDGEVAGFSCYRVDSAAGLAVGVLNGVLPAFRGRGVYRHMLRRMLRVFAERGLRRFAIATQSENVAVQRIWASEGFALCRTDSTVHVNALLATRHDGDGASSTERRGFETQARQPPGT